jgi:diphosphomevalonate decarboxylase
LCDVIAVVHTGEKEVSSTVGQQAASRSPLFLGRLASLPQRLAATRSAILQRDFAALAPLLEAEALSMHAIMMTSEPPIIYWQAETVILIHAVRRWRAEGLPVAFTIDAGPNVHLICPAEHVEEVIAQVRTLGCVDMMIVNHPAGPAHLVDQHLLGGAFATLRPML